jgi:hypothetical protein
MLEKSEPSGRGIERLRAHIESTEERLSAQNANRTEAISVLAQMTDQGKRLGLVENELRSRRSKTTHSPCAKEEADRRMAIAKELTAEAPETGASIVRKTFSEDLKANVEAGCGSSATSGCV